jgi:hypothetical protein
MRSGFFEKAKPPETSRFAGTSRIRHAGDERLNRLGILAAVAEETARRTAYKKPARKARSAISG